MEPINEFFDIAHDVERRLRRAAPPGAPPELREQVVDRFTEWLAATPEPPTPVTSHRADELPVWEKLARGLVAATLVLSATGYAIGRAYDEQRLESCLGPRLNSATEADSQQAMERELLMVRRWAEQIESWWEHRDEDLEKASGPPSRIVPGRGAGHRGGIRHNQDVARGGSIREGIDRFA